MAKATVNSILRDEHRQPYYEFIRKPRTTLEGAHQWLTKRGYKVSRLAVRTHLQDAAEQDNHFLGMSEEAQRDLIYKAAAQLSGSALASLTRYGIYLAGEAAKSPNAAILKPK